MLEFWLPPQTRGTSSEGGGPLVDELGVEFTAAGETSAYHLWASHVEGVRRVGLLVHFHGDGAWEYDNPDSDAYLAGPSGIVQAGRDRDMIVVVPKAPGGPGPATGTVNWWERYDLVRDWAHALLEHLLATYSIELTRVWFSGFSGGAEFISHILLPNIIHRLPLDGGGAVLMGGGGAPVVEPAETALRGYFSLSWFVGEDDTADNAPDNFDALGATAAGEAYYRARRWATHRQIIPGYEHTLTGLYGTFVRQAMSWAGFRSTLSLPRPPMAVFLGGRQVTDLYLGGEQITLTYAFTYPAQVMITGWVAPGQSLPGDAVLLGAAFQGPDMGWRITGDGGLVPPYRANWVTSLSVYSPTGGLESFGLYPYFGASGWGEATVSSTSQYGVTRAGELGPEDVLYTDFTSATWEGPVLMSFVAYSI